VFRLFSNINIVKIYTAAALTVAVVLSPIGFALLPVLLLVWFLFQWRWPSSQLIDFLTQYFMFFAIGLLFTTSVGPYFALLISAPQIFVIDLKFREIGRITLPDTGNRPLKITNIGILTICITTGILVVGLLVWNLTLLLTCLTAIIYFLAIALLIQQRLPAVPVICDTMQLRGISGREQEIALILKRKAKLNGMLFLNSPYTWVKAAPNAFIPVDSDEINIQLSLTPALAGPADIKIDACVIDPWGLSQLIFEIFPVKLVVIPRAKYAEWLAQKYLSGSDLGRLPLISDTGAMKSLSSSRQGIEFYGNRMYQPGDNLKNIDWKHSVKYHELVTREFFESKGQPVIILVNMVTSNPEEADILAYNIIAASISLAQDGIPAALAAYDNQKVILSTPPLVAHALTIRALELVKEIVVAEKMTMSLNIPDFGRLGSNIRRLMKTQNQQARALSGLLQIELKNLSTIAKSNPCTEALNETVAKTNQQPGVLVISNQNHDAEAVAFNLYNLTSRGNSVIIV
jgi:Protein of unknown function DUF58